MTKKDFELIASILKIYNNSLNNLNYKITGEALVREITFVFCENIASKYPKFKKDKFLIACGVEVEQKYQCGSCDMQFNKLIKNECPHCKSGNWVMGNIDD